MAGISQKFKAVISFGGNISSSWNRSTEDLKKNLSGVQKRSEQLTKEQARLVKELKKAKLAGRNVRELAHDYQRVTEEIRKTEREQSKLNHSMQRAERLNRWKTRAGGIMRRGAGGVGQFAGMAGGQVAGGLGLAVGGGVAAGALGALITPVAMNAHTAERSGVARSYGVDVRTFNAWDSLAKQYDMNGENLGDLFEEYLHKSGEQKQYEAHLSEGKNNPFGAQNALIEAFKTLGIKSGEMGHLSDIDQFNRIMEKALAMEDESKASFALDNLFGGEASKFLMLVKRSGKTWQGMIEQQKKYNLVTEEGARGAFRGNLAMTNFRTVFISGLQEISGKLGDELAPDIDRVTDNLAEWFKNGGISKVSDFLRNDLYPGALAFGRGLVYVGKITWALAKKLAWLLPDEKKSKQDVLKTLATGTVDDARKQADQEGVGNWFARQLADNPDLQEQVKKAYSATHRQFYRNDQGFNEKIARYMGAGDDDFSLVADALRGGERGNAAGAAGNWPALIQQLSDLDNSTPAAQITDNRRNTYHIEVYGAPGQDASQVADEVVSRARQMDAFNGNNALYDGGQPW
ncbi:hypothetical protein [Mixta calida]|uniref:hypothetical protein n=1 Tax=Mixta calida TaxID=665913 RepID=UPI0034D4F76B